MLKVVKPGLFATIQDSGRTGYQQYGVISSGVMDQIAFRIGNALLKQSNKAAIEMTLIGGMFQFAKATAIVLTGGMMQATINDKPISMYKVIRVKAGDLLNCGAILNGARSYLCIAGGFLVEQILGSRSTYTKAQFGGLEGRALQAQDEIPYEESAANYSAFKVKTDYFYKNAPIRILQGTEWQQFSMHMQKNFLEQSYTISLKADRMGFHLEAHTPIYIESQFQLLSEAVTFGTIQLPPSGQPIVLMADRQTTGGYPKAAQVITADLHRLAQLTPKQSLQFELISIEQAEEAYLNIEQELRLLEALLKN
ncbi:biotin-dependent carboxyltransferase family protein [Solibacillus silvestris]|uniref:5-oxoprolinase subunit C family protein n=1 Tax=Solibacillus silvestris TaxID=76853 RepID=UPI003F7E84C6